MGNSPIAELMAKNREYAEKQSFTYIYSPSSKFFHTINCGVGLSYKEIDGCVYYNNPHLQSRIPCTVCKPTPKMQPIKVPASRQINIQKTNSKGLPQKTSTTENNHKAIGKPDYPKDWIFLFQEASGGFANGTFFKNFFQSINADYNDLEHLFRTEKGDLYYVSENTVEVAVHEDYWRFVKTDGKLYLYHNDYRVLPDNTREFFDTFHIQRLTKEHTFHNMVSYICGYSWKEHINRSKQKSNTEEMRRAQINMLHNYQLISSNRLFYNFYIFIDIETQALDSINNSFTVKPRAVSVKIPNTKCHLVYCRIPKFLNKKFLSIVTSLKDLCIEKSKFDYIPACKQNIIQNQTEKQSAKVQPKSGLLMFISPKQILNKNIELAAN